MYVVVVVVLMLFVVHAHVIQFVIGTRLSFAARGTVVPWRPTVPDCTGNSTPRSGVG